VLCVKNLDAAKHTGSLIRNGNKEFIKTRVLENVPVVIFFL
jgi:hypothetical protein